MADSKPEVRVILIGGSSSVGKSTLAEWLVEKLDWDHLSTDKLARHPGRPWKVNEREVPEDVAEHYLSLSVDDLMADVLRHYRGMWRGIEGIIGERANGSATDQLVLEGSALWPESVATLDCENVVAVWLTASDDLFRSRIHALSGFDRVSAREQSMIRKFLQRTHRYNERMMAAVRRLGLASFDVEAAASLNELGDAILELLRSPTSCPRRREPTHGAVP